MMKKLLNKIRNEHGSMFIMSYLVLVVIFALGAAYVVTTVHESKSSVAQQKTTQAFHIAEAGIERAIYDLKRDYLLASPSWSDSDINTVCSSQSIACGPSTSSYFALPYLSTSLNGGSYSVSLKNDDAAGRKLWVKSTGTAGDVSQTIVIYVKVDSVSVWDNAIFAGAGANGRVVNGNVDIRGSVHILGDGLTSNDWAVELGGTAELVGNNYNSIDSDLVDRVPDLPTVTFGSEAVKTLSGELRVKHGKVGLDGTATVGEQNQTGNDVKETVDGSYVTDGYGGGQGSGNVHSDNGWSNPYDLGDSVTFPRLTDPYPGYANYQEYLRNGVGALVVTNASDLSELANIDPNSNFDISDAGNNNYIKMDGNGNMQIKGLVYVEGGDLNLSNAGSKKIITYTGTGSILTTGNAQFDVNLVTPEAPGPGTSYPDNIIGVMTPQNIGFNVANIDVMGLFYAQNEIEVSKQTTIMGTIVSNEFDMGTNVPNVVQVPETANNLPPFLIGGDSGGWSMTIVSWQKN